MAKAVNALFKYMRESKEELEKVSWPSRKDTVRYSLITVIISAFIALYFVGLDAVLDAGFKALLSLYN